MQDILTYFLHALAPSNLLVILTGTVVGIIVGALPGFTATMGIAILIPLTYTWNASTALIFNPSSKYCRISATISQAEDA